MSAADRSGTCSKDPADVMSVCTHPDGDGHYIEGARTECFCGEFWGDDCGMCEYKPRVYVAVDALLDPEVGQIGRRAHLNAPPSGTKHSEADRAAHWRAAVESMLDAIARRPR